MDQPLDANTLRQVIESLSTPRLARYRLSEETDSQAIVRYFRNMELAASLLPILSIYEIALRNAAHNALTAKYGTPDWFDLVLRGNQLLKFQKSRRTIEQHSSRQFSIDKLVSELTLGFWTHLFAQTNHRVWWDPEDAPSFAISHAWPHIPDINRGTRKTIHETALYLLTLRNRVGHHESIWDGIQPNSLPRKDLVTTHDDLIQMIGWLSPTMRQIAIQMDQFPQI